MGEHCEYEQFIQDIEFIKQHKNSWIFAPLYELTRRLVLFYEKYYEDAL